MYLAFDAGLGATLASLMHSLSPVLTALLAAVFLGERLTPLQVVGFLVGVAGVLLVLGPDVDEAGGVVGVTCGVVSVLGLSIGTLGQRWIGHAPDPLWSATIQFGVAAPPLLVLALAVEGTDVVRDPAAAGIALVYLAVVNSIIGLGLLGILVRARGAGAAASVFFLMPPVTAVLAWLILGETLNAREVAGLVITVVAVAAATRSAATASAELDPGPPEPDPDSHVR
jgi:drug/metabolite transporter (DMT)-like permease